MDSRGQARKAEGRIGTDRQKYPHSDPSDPATTAGQSTEISPGTQLPQATQLSSLLSSHGSF